jgi:hypothetical protein
MSGNDDPMAYLPVMAAWAQQEFLRLCAAYAGAETPEEKEAAIAALRKDASFYAAVLSASCVIGNLAVASVASASSALAGHVGVAIDILEAVMRQPRMSEAHKVAVREWLAEAKELIDWEETQEEAQIMETADDEQN